jgi:hemoglobin
MLTSHQGLGITEADWKAFIGHLNATLDQFQVPSAERTAVLGFMESLKADVLQHAKATKA